MAAKAHPAYIKTEQPIAQCFLPFRITPCCPHHVLAIALSRVVCNFNGILPSLFLQVCHLTTSFNEWKVFQQKIEDEWRQHGGTNLNSQDGKLLNRMLYSPIRVIGSWSVSCNMQEMFLCSNSNTRFWLIFSRKFFGHFLPTVPLTEIGKDGEQILGKYCACRDLWWVLLGIETVLLIVEI